VTRALRTTRRLLGISVLSVMMAGSLGSAAPQINNSNAPYLNNNTPGLERSRTPDEQPFATRELQERQFKRLREEHQKQMFSDTATLLRLANQLKVEVDKSDQPGPDALKNVEEIGRLAKRVSERIKTQ
jgi:hypothetical protein